MILACAVLLLGCNREEDRDFFGKIILGTPEWKNGIYFLPVDMPTKIVHSGQWVYKVESEVDGTNILVTAHITAPPHQEKQAYLGKVNLGTPKPGKYHILYYLSLRED